MGTRVDPLTHTRENALITYVVVVVVFVVVSLCTTTINNNNIILMLLRLGSKINFFSSIHTAFVGWKRTDHNNISRLLF